jgi:ADP-heptose:LPS heptosyltransferase
MGLVNRAFRSPVAVADVSPIAPPTGVTAGGKTLNFELARRIDSWLGLVICAVLFAWSRIRALLGGPAQPPLHATTPPTAGRGPIHPRRVLAIKFYGLGNIVMLLSVLGALRRSFPDVEIDFLTMGGNGALLERSGAVSHVIPVEVGGYRALLKSLWDTFRTLWSRSYDVVIDFEQFLKLSAILAFVSGAPERIGFNTDGQRRGWLYTTRVVYTDSDHMSQIFMRLLLPLQIDTSPVGMRLHTTLDDEMRGQQLLAAKGMASGHFPIIVVHMGSGANFYRVPLKRWPVDHFARLCDALVERHGAAIVFTGTGADEAQLICEALRLMKHPDAAIDACGQFNVMELTALLKQAHLTIVNDTSVLHLSAAVHTPVVAFFGPTAPLHYGPGNRGNLVFYKNLYCSPCITNYNLKVSRCGNPVCIRTIGVDEVLQGIESHLLPERIRTADSSQ